MGSDSSRVTMRHLAIPVFTVLYVVAAVTGRATVIDGSSLSLVWPAIGVGVLWFLTVTDRAGVAVSGVVMTLATVAVHLVMRTPRDLVPLLVVVNLVQVAAVVLLVHRWCPELGVRGGHPPLESPRSLLRFLVATAVGCLVGVAVGVVGLLFVDGPLSWTAAGMWAGRNICSVLGVATTGLILIHRLVHGSVGMRTPGGRLEATLMVATTGVLVALDYGTGLHFVLLLPATTVWAGLRFSPLVVSAHAALGGVAVVWLTLVGHGLFVDGTTTRSDVLLAQMFVGMTIMIGLFLAAGRQESLRLQVELHERQREIAAFARRAAHDLQGPLMVVDGWAGLLAARLPAVGDHSGQSVGESDMVDRIRDATGLMRGLVSDLLADATARDRKLETHEVDISRLAREVATSLGAADVVRVGAIEPVRGDEWLLRQLLSNLVGNALKYVEQGEMPQVDITGHSQLHGMVRLAVADRGIGIPDGEHTAVFDEFTRVHGDAYPGTGLGLSICKRIVERHDGEIAAHPRRGGGTVFEIRLPAWIPVATTRDHGRRQALAHQEA